jgi:hypothetical protein
MSITIAAAFLLSTAVQANAFGNAATHEAQSGPAKIVFYRTGGFRGALVGCSIHEKGREITHLSPNSTVSLAVSSGQHTYSSRDGASNLTIGLAVGETSYVRCKMIGLIAHPILEISDAEAFAQVSPRLTDKTPAPTEPH